MARRRGEEGVGLLELLLAAAIMGVGVVAIVGAIGVLVRSSGVHRDMSNAQVVLASAVEHVKAAAYADCGAAPGAYEAAASAAATPSGWSAPDFAATVECRDTYQVVTLSVAHAGTDDTTAFVKSGAGLLGTVDGDCIAQGLPAADTFLHGVRHVLDFTLPPGRCGGDGTVVPPPVALVPGAPVTMELFNPGAAHPRWCVIIDVPADPTWCAGGCTASFFTHRGQHLGDVALAPGLPGASECSGPGGGGGGGGGGRP